MSTDYPPPVPPQPPTVLPYASPAGPTGLSPQELYRQVPWYRRNSFSSNLVLFALLAWILAPILLTSLMRSGDPSGAIIALVLSGFAGLFLLIVCIVVLTGPVYFPKVDKQGRLKMWGVANKVVAALILLAWAYFFVSRLVRG